MSAGLKVSREGAVLTLVIDRQDRRNALDTATYAALTAQISLAAADTAVSAAASEICAVRAA